MVLLLKDHGIDDITIGEGVVMHNKMDTQTPAHAFETFGLDLAREDILEAVVVCNCGQDGGIGRERNGRQRLPLTSEAAHELGSEVL